MREGWGLKSLLESRSDNEWNEQAKKKHEEMCHKGSLKARKFFLERFESRVKVKIGQVELLVYLFSLDGNIPEIINGPTNQPLPGIFLEYTYLSCQAGIVYHPEPDSSAVQ